MPSPQKVPLLKNAPLSPQDFHPNIDNDSMVRMKRRTREEREATESAQEKSMTAEKEKQDRMVAKLTKKLADLEASGDDKAAMEEKQSVEKQITKAKKEAKKITDELDKRTKEKKWNVGNMCHVVEDRTIVAPTQAENPGAAAGPGAALEYEEFVKSYEGLIKMFGMKGSFKDSQAFLERHTDLLNEHTTGYLLLWCLQLEMDGQTKDMEVVARQQMLLQYVLDLAKSIKQDPRAAVRPFFSKLLPREGAPTLANTEQDGDEEKKPEALKGFQDDVDGFIVKLKARAIVKLKEKAEEDAKRAEEGLGENEEYVELSKEERVEQAPGGLDPLEVFETLPEVLQTAFQSQDIPKLHEAINSMDAEEAKYHIDRCVASGLWVPS
jgi:cell division cycle protein 37